MLEIGKSELQQAAKSKAPHCAVGFNVFISKDARDWLRSLIEREQIAKPGDAVPVRDPQGIPDFPIKDAGKTKEVLWLTRASEPLPCNEPCPKCGSNNINRNFTPAGTMIRDIPGNYGLLAPCHKNDHDCIVNLCTTCRYQWESETLDKSSIKIRPKAANPQSVPTNYGPTIVGKTDELVCPSCQSIYAFPISDHHSATCRTCFYTGPYSAFKKHAKYPIS